MDGRDTYCFDIEINVHYVSSNRIIAGIDVRYRVQ
jgi:hypothetical protein